MRGGAGVQRAAVVVGREVELDQLLRSVTGARAGESTCILLIGEGGVGKTRLLTETGTAGRQMGVAVLAGRAPVTTPLAFSVVAEALRSWLRGHPVEPAESAYNRGLRLVLPEWDELEGARRDLSDAQLRLLALEGVVRLVREIARANDGAVVLLDDLHAADPDSLEAARYLASAAIAGVTVIGAMRSTEATMADEIARKLRADGIADVIELEPLDERAVGGLVAALLDADAPAPLVADIMARTDGVPLLVEEVLDAHLRAGSVEVGSAGTVWRGGTAVVPRTIREMVEARLERLERVHRDVVVAGAVIGDFDPALLAASAAADLDAVPDALARGMHVGLLETTGGAVGFRHAVIRDAVLDATLPTTVDAVHRRAARALDDEDGADAQKLERRAGHLAAVGAADEAAVLLTVAAGRHLDEHAVLRGERLARRALDLAGSASIKADAADAVARGLAAQGRWGEALDIDSATVTEHGDTAERRHRMATSAIEAGHPEAARPIIARAIEGGDTSPSIFIAAGRAAMVEGDATRALDYATRVLDRAAADGGLDARLSGLELQGRAFDYLGDRGAAEAAWERQADEARVAGRTQAQLRAVVLLGKTEIYAGREPKRLFEAVDLAREAGALIELAWAQENLAIGLGLNGRRDESLAVLDDAIPRCRELHLDELGYLLMAKAGALSFTAPDTSEALLDEAEAVVATDDLRLHSSSLRADIALRRGDYDGAVRLLRVCDRIMRAMPGIMPSDARCQLIWALAARGDRQEAAELLDDVRGTPDLARWHGRPVIVAAADALLAGDEDGIDAALASAPGNMTYDIALMRVLASDILKGAARERWLRAALEVYEEVGGRVAADRVRGLLREAGAPVPRRRKAPAAIPAELAAHGVTRREAEVLQLLGEGLSNAEIATRLFLSVRTIESHVSSLLTKLDARGRGQLTARSASIAFES